MKELESIKDAFIFIVLFYLISLVHKDLPVKNIVFTTNIHYLWKGTDFEGEIL